jgi:hypothetical protein
MMQFVAPFLINFGINKAMGMSTGKALGMAGINSFLPGGGATSEAAGGIGGYALSRWRQHATTSIRRRKNFSVRNGS